jgi:hypothetical protein
MTDKFDFHMSRLDGQRTAENFIDECVLRARPERDILAAIISKMAGDDEKSKAELIGFCECVHQWMEAK